MTVYDISRPIDASLAGWPGDAPYRFTWTCRIADGSSVNLGEMAMSIHTGTHVDAPFHYSDSGAGIDLADIDAYIGPALVIEVSEAETLGVWEIENGLEGMDLRASPRLLIRTGRWRDSSRFPVSIPVLDSAAVDWLGVKGVRLLGLDIPSVDSLDSKELPIHHALGRNGIAILESLDLAGVRPGRYELIALPLKLAGADGSPVRAVLREIGPEGPHA